MVGARTPNSRIAELRCGKFYAAEFSSGVGGLYCHLAVLKKELRSYAIWFVYDLYAVSYYCSMFFGKELKS